jgi:hypothetical protein
MVCVSVKKYVAINIFFPVGKVIQYSLASHSCTALTYYVFFLHLLEICLSCYILF